MPRVRYSASRSVPYNGASGTWLPGDEREVSEESAKYLLGTFGGWFEAVEAPKAAPPISEGAADRSFTRGKKK